MDGLVVNEQPQLLTCVPDTFVGNENTPLAVTGAHILAPATLTFLDGAGQPIAARRPLDVAPDGTSATTTSPILGDRSDVVIGGIELRSADGQTVRGSMPVEVDCTMCEPRTIDGRQNNELATEWGGAHVQLRRAAPSAYDDGISSPRTAGLPSAREVSNAACRQTSNPANSVSATNMLWLWGQFIDHDIDLTEAADPAEAFPIAVPNGDPSFDPTGTGTATIDLSRSGWDPTTGSSLSTPRQQVNEITAWIDASCVYGSDTTRAAALRTNDGTGRLLTSAGDLLPFNTGLLPNANGREDPAAHFLAGDVRCNEQVGLISMHTLWVREHNRRVTALAAANPHLDGDALYEQGRMWVAALLQRITFNEFLPTLLGSGSIPAYSGYQSGVQPDVANVFSTASYRLGHSLVSATLPRLDATLAPIAEGNLALRDAFFTPSRISSEGGIDPVLRGFCVSAAEELDTMIVDDLRDFLFGPPGAGGFDLASLNIQRGRDHGLPTYGAIRSAFGLSTPATFADITSDGTLQTSLASVYPNAASLDVWLGGLAEDKRAGALVGDLLYTVIRDQFLRLRDGDRFWYARVFSGATLTEIESTTLADVLRRNTSLGSEIPNDVFRLLVP